MGERRRDKELCHADVAVRGMHRDIVDEVAVPRTRLIFQQLVQAGGSREVPGVLEQSRQPAHRPQRPDICPGSRRTCQRTQQGLRGSQGCTPSAGCGPPYRSRGRSVDVLPLPRIRLHGYDAAANSSATLRLMRSSLFGGAQTKGRLRPVFARPVFARHAGTVAGSPRRAHPPYGLDSNFFIEPPRTPLKRTA